MGLFNKEADAKNYTVKDQLVVCSHCKNDLFYKSEAQLNTPGMTFFGLDWLNKNANILICKDCGQVLWFLDQN